MGLKRFWQRLIFARTHFLFGRPKGFILNQNIKCFGNVVWRIYGSVETSYGIELYGGLIGNLISQGKPTVVVVERGARLYLGQNVKGSSVEIYSKHSISIGDYTMLGSGVRIWDSDFHSMDINERLYGEDKAETSAVNIGEKVFIGANVTVLKGVTIGDCAVIGANSLVTKDIGKNEVWAGNPAKKIK